MNACEDDMNVNKKKIVDDMIWIYQVKKLNMKSSVESQKGIIAVQRCSLENQKGVIAVQSLWQLCPSCSQQNIFELQ